MAVSIKEILKVFVSAENNTLTQIVDTALSSLMDNSLTFLLFGHLLNFTVDLLSKEVSKLKEEIKELESKDSKPKVKHESSILQSEIDDEVIVDIPEFNNTVDNFDTEVNVNSLLSLSDINVEKKRKLEDKNIEIKNYDKWLKKSTIKREKEKPIINIPLSVQRLVKQYIKEEVLRNETLLEDLPQMNDELPVDLGSMHTMESFDNLLSNNSLFLEGVNSEFIFQEKIADLTQVQKAQNFFTLLSEASMGSIKVQQDIHYGNIKCSKK